MPTLKPSLGQRAYEAWLSAKRKTDPNFFARPWARLPDQNAWEEIGHVCAQAALEALCDRIQTEALAGLKAAS